MSRARNIKPGFFKNEELAELPFEFRILFQGLWCLADREGRLEDRPKRIKAEVLPYDDVDVNAGLDALARAGFISRYSHGEGQYIQVLAFAKHQNPHCKEAASTIPSPTSTIQAQCEHGAGTGNSGTSPADSLNLIPDSLNPIAGDARPTSADADTILDLYHSILPNCQRVEVLTDERKKKLRKASKLAHGVCKQQGWPYEPAEFWAAYFEECAKDAWLRGDVSNPNNPNWKQHLGVLLAPEHFAKVMDRAISSMRGDA